MNESVKTIGWALACLGLFFGGLATLSQLGVFPLTIEVADVVLVGRRARWAFVSCCTAVSVVGVVLVRQCRRTQGS